ncbi:hypothetical protein LTR62_006105 [Meristemomyces frigidus]|uniref:SAP domain-containing protein n=1 Tax=Meristemomyces frigidus TaxID=1508187 RepID=A0AAN7TNR6_9PEZI|nr:hypothetical protein LTR62_006105 [Meristemomyces frigidus]
MADYTKKKNDDLIALCKERGLAHSGKKADFVKRLEDYDASHSSSAAPPPTSTNAPAATEEEINWDEDKAMAEGAKHATTEPASDAMAAGGIGHVDNPAAVPNQTVVEDPATTSDLTVANPEATTTTTTTSEPPAPEKAPEKDFASGLAERTIDEEIARRKSRARKFGLPEDSDEIKALERAKKFGTMDAGAVPGMLNQALSTQRERGDRKRGGLDVPLSTDSGVRKRGGGRRAGGRDGGTGGGRERSRTPGEQKKKVAVGSGGSGGWMSEADRAQAEARKARFAGTA